MALIRHVWQRSLKIERLLKTTWSNTRADNHLERCNKITMQLRSALYDTGDFKWRKAEDALVQPTQLSDSNWIELRSQPVPQRVSEFFHLSVEEAQCLSPAHLKQTTATPEHKCKLFILADSVATFGHKLKPPEELKKHIQRATGREYDTARAEAFVRGRALHSKDQLLHYVIHDNDRRFTPGERRVSTKSLCGGTSKIRYRPTP